MCFFFNDTATTEIYTLSLHDALPICDGALHRLGVGHHARLHAEQRVTGVEHAVVVRVDLGLRRAARRQRGAALDRKSTRLNSSHANISYAVFCLKKNRIIEQTYKEYS